MNDMALSGGASISKYTEKEVKVAQVAAESLKRDMAMTGRMTFNVAERLSEFQDKEYYARLGFDTLEEFIDSMGYAPSTFRKYVRVYRQLTKTMGIPREQYETLDVGKVENIGHFVDTLNRSKLDDSAKKHAIEAAVEEAWDLSLNDQIQSNNEKVIKLADGREEIDKPSTRTEPVVTDPREYLEAGVFKLVPISKEERDGDPRFNQTLIGVRGHKAKLWFNNETKLITVEIP